MEQANQDFSTPAKRPDFLSLLCILSFIGIGISLIWGLFEYINYSRDAANDVLNSINPDDSSGINPAILTPVVDYGNMALSSMLKALLNIPILLAVLMMWKQKKTGFWVYIAFELFQPVFPLLMGISLGTGVIAFEELIFAIIFIILYALNLKHMK